MINLNLIPEALAREILETWSKRDKRGKGDEQPTLADLPYAQLAELQKALYLSEDQEVCEKVEEVLEDLPSQDTALLIKRIYYLQEPFAALSPFESYLNVELEELWEVVARGFYWEGAR